MSVEPIDLGDLHLIVDRADAIPAPTSGPGDPPIPVVCPPDCDAPKASLTAVEGVGLVGSCATHSPKSRWKVAAEACGCGVLNGEDCDCAEFASQARTAARKPIFFDFRKPEAA